jgi:cell division protein FtsB
MSQEIGSSKTGAARWSEGVRRGIWAVALLMLGLVLVGETWRAREDGVRASRQEASVAREIERLRKENSALRDELRALDSDPAYLEALLRRWKRAGPGERLVE